MNNSIKTLKHTLLLSGLPISILLTACHGKKEEVKVQTPTSHYIKLSADQIKNISTEKADLINEESELSLTGEVSFDENKIQKVYPLVGGTVIKVNVSLGDYVKKGQILAILKSADVSDIQNQYEVASDNLNVAQKNLDIASELYKTNVNSEVQVLGAKNEVKKAMSEVNKLKQTLSIYGSKDDDANAEYYVKAPIEGYVVEKNVNENMEIRSDNASSIFTVSDLNTVWVIADVYESDLSKVKVNDMVDITTVAYPDRVFKGTIKHMSNVLDPQSKVVKARVELGNSEGLLKPEMFAVVKVHLQQGNKSVAVNAKAVVFENGNYYVLLCKGNQEFEKKMVTIGNTVNGKTYIKNGLNAGEEVVTNGSIYVANVD
jgi:cobalt-zinc-cadmium efflux system membrane fusion protein